ncbi:hypothetical protein HETIRDRAFT_107661 [Heterobasidion irregulare TC 32-1]|uniref:Uncharacterized protein n=1 Tax=Heterobasidion irregulare (strain TC 32-1) TaxID=747525 RepID=W4JY65_HETIT|nr:uncharacterized protein HETIRDRAFT_107661 [Heterobasidion irregulare TC 32-1]ETW78045.1 hypothetical protein HETIRDRAFT_107661 [Heterobasidion irregulare TC 32-1]
MRMVARISLRVCGACASANVVGAAAAAATSHYTAFFPFPSLPALANLIKLQPFLVTLSLPALIFSALTRMLTPLVRRMRLYVAGTDALASGCVCARGVLPDVLVFDSAVPQPDAPPKMYSSNSRPRADAPLPPPQ